jgi:hypothetical protein
MQRRDFMAALTVVAPLGAWGAAALAADLTESDAASGVRAALERGALSAVALLGKNGGFMTNPKVRIPLPGVLRDAAKLLEAVGQGKRVDELVEAMNRAAELAVPEAKSLLVAAVKSITVSDAKKLIGGADDAVTQFFAGKTREPLAVKFLPIVTRATEKVALANKYNAVAGKASGLGLLKKEDANLQQYVTGKALDGLYLMIGEEERRIRQDPIGTGRAILKKVFSGLR